MIPVRTAAAVLIGVTAIAVVGCYNNNPGGTGSGSAAFAAPGLTGFGVSGTTAVAATVRLDDPDPEGVDSDGTDAGFRVMVRVDPAAAQTAAMLSLQPDGVVGRLTEVVRYAR